MVGARGFEPPASWSRTRRSTRLSHAPNSTSVARAAARDIIELMGASTKSLYDTDFVEWAKHTADLLRRGRVADLDLQEVEEESEGLGKSERSASARKEILDHFGDSPSLWKHAGNNLQRLYREAVGLALVETNLAGHAANPDIPEECPYLLKTLLKGDLNALWPH
jgi:Domain of unknown function DUF29